MRQGLFVEVGVPLRGGRRLVQRAGEHQSEVSSRYERNPGKLAMQVIHDNDQAAASSGS